MGLGALLKARILPIPSKAGGVQRSDPAGCSSTPQRGRLSLSLGLAMVARRYLARLGPS